MVRRGATDGAGRQWRDPRGAGRVPAGLVDRAARTHRPEAGSSWRTDPKRRPAADLATSARTPTTLAAYVTGLRPVVELCAELTSFVKGRALDDNANVMLRYANGARGMLWPARWATRTT